MTVLPFSVLKFGAHDVAVEEMDHADSDERGVFGSFKGSRFLIRIQTSGIPARKMAQTALHEILHGIYWLWNVQDDDKEERIVTQLSQGLSAVLRDNPAFAKWLVETLA